MLSTDDIFQIEWACERLVRHYIEYSDAADWDAAAGLFTTNAVFARPSAPEKPIHGREAILKAYRARPSRTARHAIANTVISVIDSQTACGSNTILLYPTKIDTGSGKVEHARKTPLVGVFHDKFLKTDGEWKFLQRKGEMLIW